MRTPPAALIAALTQQSGAAVPALWRMSTPALRAISESGPVQDLGYEVFTGVGDSRRAREVFTVRQQLPQGLALLRTRLLSVRWEAELSQDYLRAKQGMDQLSAEALPEAGIFRAELRLPRPVHGLDELRALAGALPAFAGLVELLALGDLLSLGARRHASGALLGRATLQLRHDGVPLADAAVRAAGLGARGPQRYRGRSSDGALNVYLLGDLAYLHLGLEPPMAGAWPDDPDEG